jgi:hypothetical protein
MTPISVNWLGGWWLWWCGWGRQGPGFAGQEAFVAADDLGFGFALGGAAGDVGPGGLVVLHPDDDGPVGHRGG